MEGATRSAGGVWRVNKPTVQFTLKYLLPSQFFITKSTSKYSLSQGPLLYLGAFGEVFQ